MNNRILLVLPLPIYKLEGDLFVDTQACGSLGLWLEHFDRVTFMGPEIAISQSRTDISSVETIAGRERLTILPLSAAWTPHRFIAALPAAIKLLREQIRQADYLHFAIGGLWGDWASVASVIAYHLGLPYAVWTDRVESEVSNFANVSRRGLKKVYWSVNSLLMTRLTRHVIRKSSLGLFNGTDCYDAYSAFSSNPHLVYNVSTGDRDLISLQEAKVRLARPGPLRIVYAGRVHVEKGVYDWIDALSQLDPNYEATWFGDGPELGSVRARVVERGLQLKIHFPGARDHRETLKRLKDFDVFLFCHKTPESPRCLIEALQSGLPLVGYSTGYPRSLIRTGGGMLTTQNDVDALTESLLALSRSREKLELLTEKAVYDGSLFTDKKMFEHRASLMRTIPTRKW